MRPRVVFDCMIYLQALAREHSPARACLRLAQLGSVELFSSEPTLAELADVLTRPKTTKKFPELTPAAVTAFIEEIRAVSMTLSVVPHVVALPRDPKDEPYLDLAVAVQALYLVSRDRDLLELMSANSEEAVQFRTQYPDLRITEPVAFLRSFAAAT